MPNRINIGEMDRFLTAQTKIQSKTAKGQVIAVWGDAFSFFAAQTDNAVTESFSTVAFIAPVTTTFTTHFRLDLVRTMRLNLEGDFWNILNITRDRIWMKIECQRFDE
ncbi:MAG: head-tail adaptor protein [Mariniphaga sp.]